jgi:hypothetical protein
LIILETVEYVRKGIAKKTTIDYSDFFTSIWYEPVADTYTNTIYRDTRQ